MTIDRELGAGALFETRKLTTGAGIEDQRAQQHRETRASAQISWQDRSFTCFFVEMRFPVDIVDNRIPQGSAPTETKKTLCGFCAYLFSRGRSSPIGVHASFAPSPIGLLILIVLDLGPYRKMMYGSRCRSPGGLLLRSRSPNKGRVGDKHTAIKLVDRLTVSVKSSC